MHELHGETPGGVHAGEHKKESRTEGKSVRLEGKRKAEHDQNTHASLTSQPRRFNPWRQFVGSMIPNALMRYPGLSHLAKLVWGRLAQYAGQNGACYPAQATLATELATNERQIRRALAELVQEQFLGMITRGRAGTRYYFLWHPCFDQAEPLPKHPLLLPQVVLKIADDAKKIRTLPTEIRTNCPPKRIRKRTRKKRTPTTCDQLRLREVVPLLKFQMQSRRNTSPFGHGTESGWD